jgi:hypothetical protein
MPPPDPNLLAWLPILKAGTTFLVAVVGGGFALTRWLHEISENRKLREKELLWKKKAALLDRITAFGDTPGAQNAMMMMSAPERDIPLYDSPDPKERYVRVSWEEVAQAMMAEDAPLASKLSAIRDSFSDFFARLTHIELYRSAYLLDSQDIRAFLGPLARRLAEDRPHAKELRLYIRRHKLDHVENLLREVCGLDLRETESKGRSRITPGLNRTDTALSRDPAG